MRLFAAIFWMGAMAVACSDQKPLTVLESPDSKHSVSRPREAMHTHLNLDLAVDMDARQITGCATWDVKVAAGINRIAFDTRHLLIDSVAVDGSKTSAWWLGPELIHLGNPLEVEVDSNTRKVSIWYRTTDKDGALQWLSPEQTADKTHPFVYTQSQAILARTWLPVQDSPGIRFTYTARVKVPQALMALMSAENPVARNDSGVYHFRMPQPVPAYLMALAVGHVEFQAYDERTGVYAEPGILSAAVHEFADIPRMMAAAEALYGKYAWGRYDVLVLPPSFPFGGMENPRLTFATPTILAGDRSLTNLIAHELAHSWSGNLVTNATWDDFWLNEGFTVYFERRIMEALFGREYTDMLSHLGRQDLERTLKEFESNPEDTRLKLNLTGRNPDDGLSDIAYEKGCLFLTLLEEYAGRERFDRFLREYFSKNAFGTMTTESFLRSLTTDLFQGSREDYVRLRVDQWVYESGLPSNAPEVQPLKFVRVEQALDSFLNGREADTEGWTTHEWLFFLRSVSGDADARFLTRLDAQFGFSNSQNSELQSQWFEMALRAGYTHADAAMERFLLSVGRRKFLIPIFQAMMTTPEGKERAAKIYAKARPNYHSVTQQTLDALIQPI